jgi:glycosyltransferase involved in cell wall biosynthesis
MARRCGLEVFFAGMQADMTPWLSAADVVALPSRSEAYPMVLLEAAAHGRPVIATDVGGVSEIVENRKSGVLVPDPAGSDTVADLTAALDLLRDAQLRAEMGQYARTRWQAEFTPAQMARSTAEIYRAALKSPF